MRSVTRLSFLPILALVVYGMTLGLHAPVQATQDAPDDLNLSIKKVGNVWRVVLTGTTETEVHAVEGQKIIFHAEGSDVYLQFDNDKLFGGHTRTIKNGKTLTLGVGQVEKGVYVYAAFCTTPGVFAQGGSPPKIIID